MSKVEKRRLAKLRQRFLCRRVIAKWKQFTIERRPRVLTEEEETQIRTIKKWHDKVKRVYFLSTLLSREGQSEERAQKIT